MREEYSKFEFYNFHICFAEGLTHRFGAVQGWKGEAIKKQADSAGFLLFEEERHQELRDHQETH